jgi:hypothetical protein
LSIQRRTLGFVAMGLIVWSLVSTLTAAYYYSLYVETRRTFDELKSLAIDVNLLLDYGNGTQRWHNRTAIAGTTVFEILLAVTKNVSYESSLYGAYVKAIDGVQEVQETKTSGRAWLWSLWNVTSSEWTKLMVPSDIYILKPNDSVAWRYESYSYSV